MGVASRNKKERQKYAPYTNIDGNGVIIITDLDLMGRAPGNVMLMNFTTVFNGKARRAPADQKMVKIDFMNITGDTLPLPALDHIESLMDQLYTNEIDALALMNIPGMSYEMIVGRPIQPQDGSLQWSRKDLDKVVQHIRDLYTKHNIH